MLRTLMLVAVAGLSLMTPASLHAQVVIKAKTLHTMNGPAIENGVVVIVDGKITAVGGPNTPIPAGSKVIKTAVATPGLVDAHSVVGLAGILNSPKEDQDQLERSEPLQPELRAIDAYNPQERLIAWVRSFGVTTIHTGHAPGELLSGLTLIAKTRGNTVADSVIVETAALAGTLAESAKKDGEKSPGTRGKMMALLRAELIRATEYMAKRQLEDVTLRPGRDLRLEAIGRVLNREIPLLLTADRAQDIASALRLASEFKLKLWLDSAAEAYLLIAEIKAAGVPVILHPTMRRATGEHENLSFETAAKLRAAGVKVALQSGFEGYVPKTRVVLFEAALAAANGLTFDQALATITKDAAEILGIANRVGSIAVGKDGDIALFDGDPFEYTTHCTGVIIEGEVVSDLKR